MLKTLQLPLNVKKQYLPSCGEDVSLSASLIIVGKMKLSRYSEIPLANEEEVATEYKLCSDFAVLHLPELCRI